jgi:type VI secretion system protein ImpB
MQHKLDRVRRPRVQITYDVETNGAMQKVELPFVVGVLADLSGAPKEPLRALKDRKAVNIDRDNFNDVLARSAPRVAFKVANQLTDPNSKIAVELNFKHLDDFEPTRVAEQVGPLKELLEMRQELNQLLSRMEGNDKLEQLLEQILKNKDNAQKLAEHIDSQGEGTATAAPTAPKRPAAKPAPAKPAAKPEPAEEPAAGDSDLESLLGEMETPAAPASESAAAAPAEGGDTDLDALLKQMGDDNPG